MQYVGIAKLWNGTHIMSIPPAALEKHKRKRMVLASIPQVDPQLLHWTPLLTDIKRDKWSFKSKRQVC
jgi:hypothetical protein